MKQILYTFLCLCFIATGYSQIKWGPPVSDSSGFSVTYSGNSHINSRHATMIYTKTVTLHNADAGSNVLDQRSVSTVTIMTSASAYTYAVSVPTVTIKTKELNRTSGIIYDLNGSSIFIPTSHREMITGAMPAYSLQRGATNLILTTSPAALAGINPANPDGVIPATFTLPGSATVYNVYVNYHTHDVNKVEFNIADVSFSSPPVAGTSTLAAQSLTASNTMTISSAGINLPGAAPSNTFALSVNLYTLTPIVLNPYTVSYTSRERKKLYEGHLFRSKPNAGIIYVSVGIIPSVLNRQVLVNVPVYNNNRFINHTRYNESSSYSVDANAKVGVRLRRKAIIFLDVIYSTRGFKTGYDSINPFSGATDSHYTRRDYQMNSLAFGLGYSHNWYVPGRIVHPVLEASLYASRDVNDFYSSPDVNRIRSGFKLSGGIALKPNNRHDVKIMPTFFYDFTTFVKNDVSTRFYSLGLSISYGVALFNYGKK